MKNFIDEQYMKDNGLYAIEKFYPYNPNLKERAKEMRKNMIKYEKIFWENCLKNFNKRGENKITILRQKVIDNYIADFYIHKFKLIIEIDGKIHEDRKEYDKIRDNILKQYGLKILRITNEEIENNLNSICEKIKEYIEEHQSNSCKHPPSPLLEGGINKKPLPEGVGDVQKIGDVQKNINLHPSWLKHLEKEFEKPYMQEIKSFLEKEIKSGKTIYPNPKNIFAALNYTPLEEVKVVIIGQDPYHGPNQAHGLSFSVPNKTKFPPSLRNIFKEMESDLGRPSPEITNPHPDGRLVNWAKQGVLLLNAILTVQAEKAASHSKIGWQNFTDEIIKIISKELDGVVFILWGNFAKSKKVLIDLNKHFIIEGVHPSPLSASRGFFGSKPFSKTNEILKEQGKKEINW